MWWSDHDNHHRGERVPMDRTKQRGLAHGKPNQREWKRKRHGSSGFEHHRRNTEWNNHVLWDELDSHAYG